MEPGPDGYTGAYAKIDRNEVGQNVYTIPGTIHYGRFKSWVSGQRGRFGRYLHETFGTLPKAEENLRYEMTHEQLHQETQLNPMMTKDGKRIKPFRDTLITTLTEQYRSKLPKGAKFLAPFLAQITNVPYLEGANETATEFTLYGKSNTEIQKEREGGCTSYDKFAAASAKAQLRLGHDNPLSFYRSLGNNPAELSRYVAFLDQAMIDMNPTRASRAEAAPVPAMSYMSI
jgi:hypothetical protein